MNNTFAAIMFDMDGTLFDTERLGMEISIAVLKDMGIEMTEAYYAELLAGTDEEFVHKMRDMYGDAFDLQAFLKESYTKMDALLALSPLPEKPGLRVLLDYLIANDYKLAIVTATRKSRTLDYLEKAGIREYFSGIICGDMISRGKPFPDIYLKAAELLDVAPQDCLAVEDTLKGVRSAKAAGYTTVLIPDLAVSSEEEQQRCVDFSFHSLVDVKSLLESTDESIWG
ncbi:HAD family phosphatase [Ruminococcaceae bacterium OttesenSCG-928-D13]|nr:HAD family phosphatase [Ruminococcaceae bacterium OttesenSCG-928-D13]